MPRKAISSVSLAKNVKNYAKEAEITVKEVHDGNIEHAVLIRERGGKVLVELVTNVEEEILTKLTRNHVRIGMIVFFM